MALSVANVFRSIMFLPHFPLLLTVSEVFNISNKYCLLNKSAKETLLYQAPYTFPSFQKKTALFIAEAFRNIHFLPHLPNVVKTGSFEKCLRWRAPIVFEIKEG